MRPAASPPSAPQLVAALLLGCGAEPRPFVPPVLPPDAPPPVEVAAALEGCPPLDWDHVGHPALLSHCTACHAEALTGEAHSGAPLGVDLGSPEGAQAWAARSAARIREGTMPPGGGVDPRELPCLLAWLDAGAPGAGAPLPAQDLPEATARFAYEIEEVVLEDGDELRIETTLVGVGSAVTVGPWGEERWISGPGRLALAGRSRFDADGALLWEEAYDPPVQLLPAGRSATTRTRWDADGEATDAQTWESTDDAPIPDDPRAPAEAAAALLAVEAGGAEVGVVLAERGPPLARWFLQPDAEVPLELSRQISPTSMTPDSGEPLTPGQGWAGRLLGSEP